MQHTGSYLVSFILAVFVHLAVTGLMLMSWESNSDSAMAKLDRPYYIASYALPENPVKAKQAREKKAAAGRRDKLRRDRLKRAADKAALVNRKRLEAEQVRLAAEKKAAEEARRMAAEKAKSKDAPVLSTQRLTLEQEIAMEVQLEQDARRAVTDDEKVKAYSDQIKKEIIQNWSRPPSARNGMQAILRVFLVPTGEVVNVVVQDSSGNKAFDRSAKLAVEKSARFIVPKDNRQFERNFREFRLVFRPEDLRL